MTSEEKTPRQFTRSREQKILSGVCGGIAEYFEIDANLVRLGMIIAAFASAGTAVLVYLAAWMIMPE
ncbi:PspC domain-containing protein [Rhodococcus sp. NPDC058521]|uniref:PspC domain-containing protein n=1 Tax=Rhodococcus sp. NPDC058521 TaxID=3346536 RepID=UPI00365B682F